MYIAHKLEPNEVAYFKVIQKFVESENPPLFNNTIENEPTNETQSQGTSLTVQGFSPAGEVLFKYENQAQELSQTFGLSIKYYKPHVEQSFKDENDQDVDEKFLTPEQKILKTPSEGAYVFRPEWENGFT